MRNIKLRKTSIVGCYTTEKPIVPNPDDVIRFIYPDKDPIVVKIIASPKDGCSDCRFYKTIGCSPHKRCTLFRTTRSGNTIQMCKVVYRGAETYRWATLKPLEDILEEL